MADPIRYFRPIWPVLGEVRISTLVMAVLMVLLVCWRRRSPIGIAVMFGWASLYETIDGFTGLLLHHYSLSYFVWSTAAYGGWIALLVVMRIYPERLTTLAFGLLWMVWIATGFHANVTGGDFVLRDELLNEGTKSLLGVAFVLGALRLDLLSTLKRRWLSGARAVSWRALTGPIRARPSGRYRVQP